MWQRIQSVYMALAVLSLSLFFAFDTATYQAASLSSTLSPYGFTGELELNANPYFYPWGLVLNALALVLILLMFSQFKKRPLQVKLGNFSYLLCLVLVVIMYLNIGNISDTLNLAYGNVEVSYHIGCYLPVLAIAFLILANRAIKKDEKLVRSLDRIR